MRTRLALVALTLSGILFVGAQPALAAGRTSESVPGHAGVPIEGACGFTPGPGDAA